MEARSVEEYQYQWDFGTPVVAIDLGTSRSACSVTFIGREKTSQELLLPEGCGVQSFGQYKASTALLVRLRDGVPFDPQCPVHDPSTLDVVAFGDTAERVFAHMPAEERLSHCFCKWFKMLLHTPSTSSQHDPVIGTSRDSLRITLSAAIAKTLELFKDEALKHLKRTSNLTVDAVTIPWILTVPAIWSDRAKYMMRCAAFNAGLLASVDSDNLILCLEPEGVAFHALFDGTEEAIIEDFYGGDESKCSAGTSIRDVFSRRGSKFLVVDAGGGTVDFGAYEVVHTHPFKVKQIAAAVGGPFGSTQVDRCFLDLVYDIIGEEAAQELGSRLDVQYDLLHTWESVKLSSTPSLTRRSVVQLAELQTDILTPLGLSLKDCVEQYLQRCPDQAHVTLKGETRLELSPSCIAAIFATSVNHIVDTMLQYRTSTRAGEADYIFLAGGYSQCPYVRDAINANFSEAVKHIFLVSKPDTAIVRGAAIYGTGHRQLVTHRVSQMTYGIRTVGLYKSSDPDHTRRSKSSSIVDDKGFVYIPVFTSVVREGQEIPSGFTSEPSVCAPLIEDQDSIQFTILVSPRPEVRDPDEDGVRRLANFFVPVDTSLDFEDRLVNIEFEFGGTEIFCRAKDFHTNEVVGAVACKFF